MRPRPPLRCCAVYTRKSSEEGLEQDFNSLDAQREAGTAYVKSQRHEGWRLLTAAYDDGGYSGGTLDRPALQRLLVDIRAGKVQIVVVYKVDRLTRSLADFAKLIELFDAHGVSFVSVTQQFNTTTSMGRLMLNVLLSFAQFEREVTGERIRDKIAASKKKGLWMGGTPPLGYDARERKLILNETEAKLVRHIFRRYAELGTVVKLMTALESEGHRSKRHTSASGRTCGGWAFSRGHLYRILSNRIYRGEIVHKDAAYPGEHQAIVEPELWDRVQALLASNHHAAGTGERVASPALLKGLIFDGAGNRMSPAHAVKGGIRYRYYVSQAVLQGRAREAGSIARLPARELEQVVINVVFDTLTKHERTRIAAARLEGWRSATAGRRYAACSAESSSRTPGSA
jgi:site-specific DNA recombinase